jgi:predicted glycosyltransferase
MSETLGDASTESLATGHLGTPIQVFQSRHSLASLTARKPPDVRTFLLYAQDSKGMGHIARSRTIARSLLAAHPNSVAYLVTESPIIEDFPLPERCKYVKLPPHLTSNPLPKNDAADEALNQHVGDDRARLLRDIALELAPDLVLVDHSPLGHKGEFRDGLLALKAQCPDTKFVCGLRDLKDDPARTRARWQALGVYDAFESLYDGIAVYGLRTLYDVAEAYAIPPSVRSKLFYCGYIVREQAPVDAEVLRLLYGLPQDGRLVVATVGSGKDGYRVLEAAQAAVERLRTRFPSLNAIFVTGPFMPAEQAGMLKTQETPRSRVVSQADNLQLVAAADAVVGMGGYNSVYEALSLGRPLVIVPRDIHRAEQRIRAAMLASLGLARAVQPNDLTVENLAEALEWALCVDRRAHARLVREIIPSFDGAERLTAYLGEWLDGDRMRSQSPLKKASSVGQAS